MLKILDIFVAVSGIAYCIAAIWGVLVLYKLEKEIREANKDEENLKKRG